MIQFNKTIISINFFLFLNFLWLISCLTMEPVNDDLHISIFTTDSIPIMKINEQLEIKIDYDILDYQNISALWFADHGTVIGHGFTAQFTAPAEPCTANIFVNLTDQFHHSFEDTLQIFVYKQLVILKADDLNYDPEHTFHPGYENFLRYLEERNIKAALGIVGKSLINGNDKYISTLKEMINNGLFEIWNHGFNHILNDTNEIGELYHEFWNTSYNYQKEQIEKVQNSARDKLGITIHTFGSPGNQFDENTLQVIDEHEDLNIWFFGDPRSSKLVLERICNIEFPTFFPDYQRFMYNRPADAELLVLQIHPKAWESEGLEEFKLIMDYLIAQKVVFTTAYEYYKLTKR